MAKSKNLINIGLQCSEGGHINYTTTKNRMHNQVKIALKKYSPYLRKHTLHREVKLK